MVSAYGYITALELENYTATNYVVVNSDYKIGIVEAWISQAERLINTYIGTSFSGTIPDGIKYVCLELASKIAQNRLILDGLVDRLNIPKYNKPYIDSDLEKILDKYLVKEVSPIRLHRLYNNDRGTYYG